MPSRVGTIRRSTPSPDQKLLRVFDLAAVAIRALAESQPVALFVDDLQWADEDSVRMLRYIVRTDPTSPSSWGSQRAPRSWPRSQKP